MLIVMYPGEYADEVKKATIDRFSSLWYSNFLANREDISKKYGVRKFFGKFRDIPGIIVGAGPSLDKNIKSLKHAKNRSVIIACDAVLRILINEKIVPSFVVILDPQDCIVDFFQGMNTREIILIAPTIVHPKVLQLWQGRVVFYNKFAPDIPVLKKIEMLMNSVGSLTPGGSVLSVAYDFMFKAGCNPVIFTGQDLSYSDDALYAGSRMQDELYLEKTVGRERENMVFEKDMFGQTVPTSKSMSVTRIWFEWAFSTWKREGHLEVINSTEGGILTEKCSIMPLSEAIYKNCSRQINLHWTINKIFK